jgi:hypothetical protein
MSTASLFCQLQPRYYCRPMSKESKKTTGRSGKVLPEHLEEAAALRKLWESREHDTQTIFGEKYKIGNQSAVGQFLNGKARISMKAAVGFAKGLGCEISDFSPRLAAEAAGIRSVQASDGLWPFPGIDRVRFDRLSSAQKLEIQGALRSLITAFEQESRHHGNRKAA